MSARAALRRAGLSLPALARSLWVIAPDGTSIDQSYDLLDAVLQRRPGYLMVLSTPVSNESPRLLYRYEREVVLPLPYGAGLRRFARRINPALAVLLGPANAWRARWQERLQKLGLPFAIIEARDGAAIEGLAGLLPPLAVTRAMRDSLRRPSGFARLLTGPIGRLAMPLFSRQQIRGWGELADCLGNPKQILCLGNGPSSEEPVLEAFAGDTLFRVNWRWRERGFLAAPNLVFVGDPTTPQHVAAPALGFRSAEDANYVLWRQCLGLRPPRFRYFIFDEMKGAGSQGWAARPTNGAIMVATAAALRPQRLVIAGIDLYSHPRGRHPGGDAHDGYNRVHERDVEIDMMGQALAGFAGELRILSPILAAALAGEGTARAGRRVHS
jgi:hypothetical protein